MPNYALIDNASGFVMWQGFESDPIAACEAADNEINAGEKREYNEVFASELASNQSGYHVYQLEPDYREIEDGCDELEIQSVEQHERVAVIRCTTVDGQG